MITVNDNDGFSALKYLQGVNIYQQSVGRPNSNHQGYFGA